MTTTEETDVGPSGGGAPRHLAAFALLALAAAALLVWLTLRPRLDDETRRRMLTDLATWDAATPEQRMLAARWVAAREPAFALLRLERFSCGGQSHEVAVLLHAATGLEFSLVPGGTFLMGSPETDAGSSSFGDEAQHAATLSRPFLIARTECTQEAYERVVGSNPSTFPGASRPVETVSSHEASAFCGRVGLALPTEMQWEYGCRAGTTTAYSGGESIAALQGADNVRDVSAESYFKAKGDMSLDGAAPWDDGFATTSPVGTFRPNALGLFDMHGNVVEWCLASNPATTVFRGGGCFSTPEVARSCCRLEVGETTRTSTDGFRPAKDVALE